MVCSPCENTRVITRVARAGVWLKKQEKYLKSPKSFDDKILTNVLFYNRYVANLCNKRTEEDENSPSTRDSLTSRFLTADARRGRGKRGLQTICF